MAINHIWTLWWQGEENAPEIVRKCFASMREHKGNAEVHILDKGNVGAYIEISPVISEKFHAGNISLTHLSDIIRFELLCKYGGLWIDSTVFLTGDIPDWIFDMEFYSIRDGVGEKDKNIAGNRWTAFIIGGQPGNPVAEGVRWLFDDYWKQYDRLVCYGLIDFCLNDVYDALPEARELIDAVPVYEGNVLEGEKGIFHKKSWKKPKGNLQIARLKSLARYIKTFFDFRNIADWGIRINWYTFWSSCMRRSKSSLAQRIAVKYNDAVSRFLGGAGRLKNSRENKNLE